MRTPKFFGVIALFVISFGCSGSPLVAQNHSDAKTFEPIDAAMVEFMETVDATAATVAVSRSGEIIYSQGYGFSDRRGRIETTARTTMRLASCTKPITATAIRQLIESGKISDDTLVFDYLGIRPDHELADERIRQITIAHLLDHRGGWDRDSFLDPMYKIEMIRKAMRVRRLEKHHIVQYMWNQPLQADPGSADHYSNFGYLLLGLVIEKATDQSYIEAVRELVSDPLEIDNIDISSPVRRNRKSREVHYSSENGLNLRLRDSASGLAANSESLCRFMSAYWLDGKERSSRRRRYFFQFGSHPFTTTTIMEQRLDGFDYAFMLNSRREDHYNEDNEVFRNRFNDIIDSLREKLDEE